MKSEMPYHGVQTQARREIARKLFAKYPFETFDDWSDAVRHLWHEAKFREERYATLDLCGDRRYDEHQTTKALPLYEELITTGAWWDYVDNLATQRFPTLLRREPKRMKTQMRKWSKSRDMWKRRTSIICQIKMKTDTDVDLLHAAIEESMDSDEFFLRKGIGWALREHAKTDSKDVIRFVRKHRKSLSVLSKREAVRNLIKAGELDETP